jgi:hypothetical protein
MLPFLRKHYSSAPAVRRLLHGGSMSTIGPTVRSTYYYGRDAGQVDPGIVKPETHKFMPDDPEALEYQYLFDDRNGGWWWRENGLSSWHAPDEAPSSKSRKATCHHCHEPIDGTPVTVHSKPPKHYHAHHVKHHGVVAKRIVAKRRAPPAPKKEPAKKGILHWLFG